MIFPRVPPQELTGRGPLVPYSRTFARMMGYKDFDPERFFGLFQPKLQQDQAAVWVALDEERFEGCCMVNITTCAFTGEKTLTEVMWGSSLPGVGRKLRELAETWGKEKGCSKSLWGVTETPYRKRAAKSLRASGYRRRETLFEKEL